MSYTHVNASTQFVQANGIRFAYRRFGKDSAVPLLFMQLPGRHGPLGSGRH
jgi:hypothetical protein